MKKAVLLTMLIISSVCLIGCGDKRDGKDISIKSQKFIDTSDTVKINGYNGYQMSDSSIIKNEDGSYTITIKMNKLELEK